MGCDIHCYLEVYDDTTKKWNHTLKKDQEKDSGRLEAFYHDRNYSLFAWLGCTYRRPHIPSINEPRGMPPDVSSIILEWFKIIGEHTPSYFTFEELLPYLELDVVCKVFVKKEFMDYVRRSKLEFRMTDWGCHYINELEWVRNPQDYEEVSFTLPIDEFMGNFKDLIKKEAVNHKNLNHVRIVFWFDN